MKLFGLNKLSKEKRKELILVLIATIGVLSGLGFGLVKYQYGLLVQLQKSEDEARGKLASVDKIVKRAVAVEEDLAQVSEELTKMEEDMASSDQYYWMDTMLRKFKRSYQLEISQISQPGIGPMNLLPDFPYRQATIRVSGIARFHELGRFIADFENQFPHIRLLNLEVTPASGTSERGMLNFSFEVAALINPNAS